MTSRRLSGILPLLFTAVLPKPLPPPPRDDLEAWLRLTLVPGVSPKAQQNLLRALGPPEQALASRPRDIARAVGDEEAKRLAAGPDAKLIEKTLRWLSTPGHHLLALGDAAYPQVLLEIPDPPTVIYAVGRVEFLGCPSLAVVGSRNATPQGARDAEAFARDLSAAGLTIVSGLALGIDGAAHRGGLSERGSTVAVLGTGADRVYPAGHRGLAHEIADRGCLASEFPLGTPPTSGNFPQRNRLISGLARGVLVIEAAERSGSLITARCAGEQGREVFALPGSIHSPLARGCHKLIREGAKLVECAQDVLTELGIASDSPKSAKAKERDSSSSVLRAMGHGPVSVDEIAHATGQSAAAISAELARLEIAGRVEPLAGGRFQRVTRQH
ncbi:MAG TPA: DNA-processing protein DprA [Usitatibacter sp.]|nr:DNA-processing protein DprA [Usitatibacter sp.]